MINLKLFNKKNLDSAFFLFSKKEKKFFILLVTILIVSTLVMLQMINKTFMVAIPMRGGSTSVGIASSPRFINPILASSPADLDIVAMVYSGLMRKDKDGKLIPDLAASYDVSKNGLIYTFTLKDNLFFQDNTQLTTNDIAFTINKIKDPIIKSPYRVNWDGVSMEIIDEKNIRFTLKQPYASFLENMTLGIMPSHIWDSSPIELNTSNTSPIGTGPYMIKNTIKKTSGVIESYEFVPFEKFALGKPYIQTITMHFYLNEEELLKALNDKEVDQVESLDPLNAEILEERNFKVHSMVLPRIFGLFFNQNQNQVFTDKNVIRAINQAINKEAIVKDVLLGYGKTIENPIPESLISYNETTTNKDLNRKDMIQKIQNDLAKAGWKKGEDGILEKVTIDKKKKTTKKLTFSISTGNTTELVKTAEQIKNDLLPLGIQVDIKTFDTGNLNQNVIRPRKYDALLFGEIINHESDLFAFWHSSQRRDPGLNVAMYTNAKVDKILEDAFVTVDDQSRNKKYLQFEDEIRKDMPAVFLYSPDFIYIMPDNIKNFERTNIISPGDRYLNIYSWYINTENVWKIFAKK